MPKANISHDCSLINSSGKEIGLTLLRDKNNKPYYQERGDPALSNQFYVGEADYAYLPPDKELMIGGDADFREGFGLLRYDPGEPKRYRDSFGVDARFRGHLLPGPLPTAIATPSDITATLLETGFETVTHWQDGDTVTRSDTQKQAGTYSGRVATNETGKQSIAWSATFQGRVFHAECYTWSTNADAAYRGQIGIYDGVSTTWSAEEPAHEVWTKVTVTKVLDAAASELTICLDNRSSGDVAYFDTATFTEGNFGAPVCAIDFNDELYVAFGKTLAKLNATGDGWTSVFVSANAITGMEVFTDDCLYIACGHGNNPFYLVGTVTAPTISEAGFETVTDWQDGDTVTRSGTQEHAGTYSGSVADEEKGEQTLTWSSTYQAKAFLFNCWVWEDDASSGRIGIYDGVGTSYSHYHTGGSGWEHLGVQRTLDASATELTLYLDNVAAGDGVAYFDDATITPVEIITETTQASNDAVFFKTLGVTLWKADTPRELRSATEPKAGAWSAATNVGSTAYDITGLNTKYISGTERLVIHKENGTFYLDDDGNAKNLAPVLRTDTHANGGKNSIEWKGSLYMPYGGVSLWEYTTGEPINLAPGLFTTNSSDFDGDVQAVAGDSTYLFAGVDNGDYVEILAGGWENVDGYDDWRWHPIAHIELAGCNGMYVSTVFKKRLWIFSTSSSDSVYYLTLPTGYGNVGADTNLTFKSAGYLITPWQYANLKGDPKAWTKLTLTVSDVDSTNYWTAYYQLWGETLWTTIGTFGADGSTVQTRYIPDDASGNKPQSPLIRFKFACTSDGAAPAPHLLTWDCRGMWYPSSKRKLIEMRVLCADGIIAKNGKDLIQTEKMIRDFLNKAYDPDTPWPLGWYPPYFKQGDSAKRVKLIDPFEQELVFLGKEQGWNWVYTLTLEEVALS